MKSISALILSCLLLLGCSKEQTPKEASADRLTVDSIQLGHSMKGWELYSWPDGTNWKYSILIGTNRNKNLNEVLTGKFVVTGIESLKAMLDQLPADESVFWSKRVSEDVSGKLAFPETQVQNDIKAYCERLKLKLYISN